MLSNSLRTETRVTKTEMYKGKVLRNMRMRGLYNSKILDNFKIFHIVMCGFKYVDTGSLDKVIQWELEFSRRA